MGAALGRAKPNQPSRDRQLERREFSVFRHFSSGLNDSPSVS